MSSGEKREEKNETRKLGSTFSSFARPVGRRQWQLDWNAASGPKKPEEKKKVMGTPGKARHYKELLIWQKGMVLAKLVYKLTARFPPQERFGLTAQLRRAAVSVPSNIAEGQARQGTKEFLQFLSHAVGSLAEVETQILLSLDLCFAHWEDAEASLKEIDELQKMITSLKEKLASYLPLASRHSPLPSTTAEPH